MSNANQLTQLLFQAALACVFVYPDGTIGSSAMHRRARCVKAGDFVIMLGLLTNDVTNRMGVLRSVEPPIADDPHDEHEYTRKFLLETIDGRLVEWSNVRCVAIPMGETFTDDLDRRFQIGTKEGCR